MTVASPSRIVYDPAVSMPGQPTLEDHRMGAQFIAELAWHQGLQYISENYPQLTRWDVLVCCWWVGRFDRRKVWRQRFHEWAEEAFGHLWYCCDGAGDPPTAVAK